MRAIEKGIEAWRILPRRARAFDAPLPSRYLDPVPMGDRSSGWSSKRVWFQLSVRILRL
jgi:hypothetical protein